MGLEKLLKEKAAGRQRFIHEGRTVYEWKQTLDEVYIWIPLPSTVSKRDIKIEIQPRRLMVGLVSGAPYLQEEFFGAVELSESVWYLARVLILLEKQSELCIDLRKARPGEMWSGCFIGHGSLDIFVEQEVKRQMMLERFQAEHPGFDFSNAEFSGEAPDPRTFLGGMRKT